MPLKARGFCGYLIAGAIKDLISARSKALISDSWDRFSNSLSYAEAWIRKFIPNGNYNMFC